jgi:FtsP/CotA-like multicopper oxidase with cupredoxin domain
MDRRHLLQAGGAAASLLVGSVWVRRALAERAGDSAAAAIAKAAIESACRTAPPFDTPLHLPGPSGLLGLSRVDGPLEMIATPVENNVAGQSIAGLGYVVEAGGRRFVDPTLRLDHGQQVEIDFLNALAEPTTVHWHGLSVDTANDGSGLTHLEPGQRQRYRFTVRDRASLYWYHPHPHGMTASQAARGLMGLLWVDGDEERALRARLDLKPGVSELPLLLTDALAGAPLQYDATQNRLVGVFGNAVLVNFTARARLDVERRPYRLRLLNASNARNLMLAVCQADGRKVPFRLLGVDGGLLERALEVSEIFVSPAERVDVLVDFSRRDPGESLWLWSLPFDAMIGFAEKPPGEAEESTGTRAVPHHSPGSAAAGAAAPGAPQQQDRRAPAVPAVAAEPPLPDGSAIPILRFVVRSEGLATGRPVASEPPTWSLPAQLSRVASADYDGAPVRSFRLGFARRRWRINDRVYDLAAYPVEVRRGTREIWLVRNYHTSMPHAVHLHGFHFHVLRRETSPDDIAARAAALGLLPTDLGWKDTVLVWPGETVRLGIDFTHPFVGPQTYLFHCHNLEHEDQGMMLNVRVS